MDVSRRALFLLATLGTAVWGACLESDARPYEDYLADLPEQVDPIAPDAGPPLCTETSGAAITVEFVNRTGRNGRLVWANELCATMQYATIRNGEMHSQGTYVGHAWRLLRADDDQILDQVIVGEGQTSVTFQ